MIEAHLEKRKQPKIIVSDERDEVLETGGGVKKALPLLGNLPFLIHNSDSVWHESGHSKISQLLAGWDGSQMDALLLVTNAENSLGYEGNGDFFLEDNGRLHRRNIKEKAPFVFAGVSVAHPRLFVQSPDGRFSLNQPWDIALARGRVYGVEMQGTWMHVGTPEALAEAELEMARLESVSLT